MRVLGLSFCLLLTLVCSPLLAQSQTKGTNASIVFDMRMGKILSSPLGKSLDLKGKMADAPKGDGPDMSKLVRVFGAMTAPENMKAIEKMQQGDISVDFFVRMEFTDADGASSMLKQAIDDNSGVVEKNGKKYYKAPEKAGMPDGVMMYQVDAKTIEIGSEGFAFRTKMKPFTANLNKAWSKVPDDAIRLAVDMESADKLIKEMVAQGKESAKGNPVAGAYFDLLTKMKDMTLSIDLTNKNLVTMQATGKNASSATELKEGFDSMLGMAKMAGKMQVENVKRMDADGGAVLEKLLDGMNAKLAGQNLTVAIPKPAGFDKVVEKLVNQFGGMLGGMAPGF